MKLYWFFAFCLFNSLLIAQEITADTPRWVVGTEANFLFQDLDYYTSNFYYGLGLQVEKPLGKFSLGTGLIQQQFGKQYFKTPSGEFKVGEDGAADTYGFNEEVYQLRFINIPLRLQYRLPCNCAYVQAGLQTSFRQLDAVTEENRHIMLSDQPNSDVYNLPDIKSVSLGYELAFGMNIHISSTFKMFGRLSYVQYGFSTDQDVKYKKLGNTFMGLNIGLQYAIY